MADEKKIYAYNKLLMENEILRFKNEFKDEHEIDYINKDEHEIDLFIFTIGSFFIGLLIGILLCIGG